MKTSSTRLNPLGNKRAAEAVASRYRVQWTAHAAADLAAIIRFISRDSPLNAKRVYQRIRRRTETLRNFPDRGHIVPELAELDGVAYRELSLPPYRILYRTENQTVFVQAVLDGRRDLREILAERLLRVPADLSWGV